MTTDLFSQLQNITPENALFMHPGLTEEDKILAQNIYDRNMAKINKELEKDKDSMMTILDKDKMVRRLDLAIKAVLQHRLNKRGGV